MLAEQAPQASDEGDAQHPEDEFGGMPGRPLGEGRRPVDGERGRARPRARGCRGRCALCACGQSFTGAASSRATQRSNEETV